MNQDKTNQQRRPTPLELSMGRAAAQKWIENKKAEEAERKNRPSDSDIFAKLLGID